MWMRGPGAKNAMVRFTKKSHAETGIVTTFTKENQSLWIWKTLTEK